MASAQKAEYAARVNLPSGEGDTKRTYIGASTPTIVQIAETTVDDDGNGQSAFRDLGQVPLGTKEIFTQHRMCGDFYCAISGAREVSATGDTLEAAFLNALAQARKAA